MTYLSVYVVVVVTSCKRSSWILQKDMRRPGIEPRANAWKAFMLPLHHRRDVKGGQNFVYKLCSTCIACLLPTSTTTTTHALLILMLILILNINHGKAQGI